MCEWFACEGGCAGWAWGARWRVWLRELWFVQECVQLAELLGVVVCGCVWRA